MSDITIEALKLRRREIEINVAMNQGALEEIDNIIREMERRRGGRPRKAAGLTMINEPPWDGQAPLPAIIPQRVAGGVAETETDKHLFPEDAA